MDRSELILDIFATRARSREARMQVELAQLEYLLPRLRRMWSHLSRIRGGIGLRGPGETQLETDRRLIGTRISDLKEKLREVAKAREQQRKSRQGPVPGGAGGLHQRRQVVAAAGPLRCRPLRRGPPLRHAGLGHPHRGPGLGLRGADHRHGRLHPQAAPPPGRFVPLDPGGGAGGRRAPARHRRLPPGLGGAAAGRARGAGRPRARR